MNGHQDSTMQTVRTTRNINENINYQELLRASLETVDSQAVANAAEVLSDHSRSIVQSVAESFTARYQDAMDLFSRRLDQGEKDLRWRKVLGFAFKSDLSKEAWKNKYPEFIKITGRIEKNHARILNKFVAAHIAMVNQAVQALAAVSNNQRQSIQHFLPPGVQGNDKNR